MTYTILMFLLCSSIKNEGHVLNVAPNFNPDVPMLGQAIYRGTSELASRVSPLNYLMMTSFIVMTLT